MVNLVQQWWRGFTNSTITILIVEPDPTLRKMERWALSSRFRVIEAASPEEAVRTAAKREVNLDLLLTEARLPKIDGWDLAQLLKLDYPALKVIYLADSIDAEIRAHTRRSTVVVMDKKRFRPEPLRKAVRDVVEKHREHPTDWFLRFRRWAKP